MKISIIIASYNYAQYLEETIESVLEQTYSDWELIIVDDCSSDNSIEIIKSYCEKDSRIKFFQHENVENRGLKETLLLGLKNATGDWIAFLESDDVFEPDNLLKKVEIAQQYPSAKLIFNKVKFLCEDEKTKKRTKTFINTQKKLSKIPFFKTYPRNMFYDFYINNIILTFSCVMVETNAIKNADFNTPVDTFLDWWLWINLAYKNDFYYIDEELTSWRLHPKSYVLKGKKPIFCPIQTLAYSKIYRKDKSLKLFLFIFLSNIKLFFVRGFRFLRRICGRLKSTL